MGMVNPLFHDKFLMYLWLYVKKGLTVSFFNISTFSMALCLLLLYLMEIFPKTHNFWNKTIVKQCLTVVKYFETTINTKFLMVNHYLPNCNTEN